MEERLKALDLQEKAPHRKQCSMADPSNPKWWQELHRSSRASAFGLEMEGFRKAIEQIAAKHGRTPAEGERFTAFVASLQLEELALARACAAGHEKAWESFLLRYREKLYAAARSITREDLAARELADSIYAELYGLSEDAEGRRSKLLYYSGRGSLEGWLRTVLAQEWVNRLRKSKRLVSLEEEEEAGAQFVAKEASVAAPENPVLAAVTDEALRGLGAEDRYILASYFLDGRTLAEVARTLGVHESTISRKVERLTAALRKSILKGLQHRGLSSRQAEEALDSDVRDVAVDLNRALSVGSAAPAVPPTKVQGSRVQDTKVQESKVQESKKSAFLTGED